MVLITYNWQLILMIKMAAHNFKLKEGQSYIQLNNLLQVMGLAQTGGHAKILIQNEEVLVNGIVETRIRKKLIKQDLIEIGGALIKII